MGKKIKELYGIDFELKKIPEEDECAMHEWFERVINKTYEELDLFDVTRMIIQKMFVDMAIVRAEEFLRKDPFCGQRYDGELLELLSRLDVVCFEKHKRNFIKILLETIEKNKEYEWGFQEKVQRRNWKR